MEIINGIFDHCNITEMQRLEIARMFNERPFNRLNPDTETYGN